MSLKSAINQIFISQKNVYYCRFANPYPNQKARQIIIPSSKEKMSMLINLLDG
jgi:hypothetical protein